jgi:effector-binding domain-containing protein
VSFLIETETATARPIAAVSRLVRVGEVVTVWKPALDNVCAYLRSHDGLWAGGHNVFVYHRPPASSPVMEAEVGVEVPRIFEGRDEVICSSTPEGPALAATRPSYGHLADAHAAIDDWRRAHGLTFAGESWETYGDPDENQAVPIRVSYLLA